MPHPLRAIGQSLRYQLLAGFAVVIVLFAITAGVAVNGLESVRSTTRHGTQLALLAQQVATSAYNTQASQGFVALSASQISNHLGDDQSFVAALDAFDNADGSSYGPQTTHVRSLWAAWRVYDNRIISLSRAGNAAAATALVTGPANLASDALVTALSNLSSLSLAVGIALVLSRRIIGGVRQVLNAATALADGDLHQTLDVRTHDEVGAMARAFSAAVASLQTTAEAAGAIAGGNFAVAFEARSERDELGLAFVEMRDRLSEMVRAISGASDVVAHSSRQMASSSSEVGRAIGEIAESISSVATGADQQVRSVSVAREVSREVADASQTSADNARETVTAMHGAREVTSAGLQAARDLDAAMEAAASSSSEAATAMRELGAKSSQIGGIVETITTIAEQTNLLALNAAIEAARAGDEGRGFAVVADEVRKLAEESQTAAAAISDLIAGIQRETERAVVVVDEGARQTERSVEAVAAARTAFEQIGANVEDMSARVEQIATASLEVVESSERMLENVSSVAAVAEQSSAATEQVSAATEQTSASSEEISATAHELSGTAQQLQELVSQFRLS
jgi:methyl-accepting chemotaxis protein